MERCSEKGGGELIIYNIPVYHFETLRKCSIRWYPWGRQTAESINETIAQISHDFRSKKAPNENAAN